MKISHSGERVEHQLTVPDAAGNRNETPSRTQEVQPSVIRWIELVLEVIFRVENMTLVNKAGYNIKATLRKTAVGRIVHINQGDSRDSWI